MDCLAVKLLAHSEDLRDKMKLKLSELEQIISEEVDAVVTPTEVSPLDRYILNESKGELIEEQLFSSLINKYGSKALQYAVKKLPKGKTFNKFKKYFRKKMKTRRRGRRGRSKASRQAILLKRINKDSSGASKKYDITIKDLQTALASIPDKRVQRFAKKARPGKYDRNTYRAIVSFQRKYRGELQDKRLDGLVGPSTIGVLRKYDKSGTFSRKLDTKGVAIGASDKMLASLDKVVKTKPGQQRREALVNIAMKQPEDFMKYFQKLRKMLKIKGGMVQLEQLRPAPVGSSKLSDTELASSKRLQLMQDFREALAIATERIRKSGDKKLQARFAAAAKKFNFGKTIAKTVKTGEKATKVPAVGMNKKFDKNKYEAVKKFLQSQMFSKSPKAKQFQFPGDPAVAPLYIDRAANLAARSNLDPAQAVAKIKSVLKSKSGAGGKKAAVKAKPKSLIAQFPRQKNLVDTNSKITIGGKPVMIGFDRRGMTINGAKYKFTSDGRELKVNSVVVPKSGTSVTMKMSFFGISGSGTFADQQLLSILDKLFSGRPATVDAGGKKIVISKR